MMLIRADCGEQKVDRFVHRQLCIHMMHLNHMLLKKTNYFQHLPDWKEGRKEKKASDNQTIKMREKKTDLFIETTRKEKKMCKLCGIFLSSHEPMWLGFLFIFVSILAIHLSVNRLDRFFLLFLLFLLLGAVIYWTNFSFKLDTIWPFGSIFYTHTQTRFNYPHYYGFDWQ